MGSRALAVLFRPPVTFFLQTPSLPSAHALAKMAA